MIDVEKFDDYGSHEWIAIWLSI